MNSQPTTQCADSGDNSRRLSREDARRHAVRALTRAESIAESMTPGSVDYDEVRVRSFIDIATEWRYLADQL